VAGAFGSGLVSEAERPIMKAAEKNSRLSREANVRLITALENEQRRLGEAIHDSICQTLTALNMALEQVAKATEKGQPIGAKTLDRVRTLSHAAINQARSLSRRLNPCDLAGAGLMTALQELAQERHAELVCPKAFLVPDREKALALYRMAIDATEPAHISADVKPTLRLEMEDQQYVLTISGLPKILPANVTELITARAESLGGKTGISRNGPGTTLVCSIPSP
jgi:two-component system, LuxR family, sensor kinase FixL